MADAPPAVSVASARRIVMGCALGLVAALIGASSSAWAGDAEYGKRRQRVAAAMDRLDDADLLIYEPRGRVRFQVTVFTDIQCPYCRQLHRRLNGYLDNGIRIRYAFLPQAGIGSRAYREAVAVWCADHPHRALTRAKRGEPLRPADCPNPVADHYRLARGLGIRGTPAIIGPDGQLLGGYLSPAALVAELEAGG